MFGNLLFAFGGFVLAIVMFILWPERFARWVSAVTFAIGVSKKIKALVERHPKALLLVVLALTLSAGGAGAQQLPGPPAATVDAWYEWILAWLLKPAAGPALAGLVCSWIFTQRWKLTLPADMQHDQRRRKTQRVSFYVAFVPCFLLWPIGWMFEGMTARTIYLVIVSGLLVSTIVGCLSPVLYAIGMSQLYKRGWIDETFWSGEARAEVKRQADDPAAPPP